MVAIFSALMSLTGTGVAWWQVQDAKNAAASGEILSVGNLTHLDRSGNAIRVGGRSERIRLSFRPGKTGSDAVLMVQSGPLGSSNGYYPLAVSSLHADSRSGTTTYTGQIPIGEAGDVDTTFAVMLFAVPPTMRRQMDERVKANTTGIGTPSFDSLPAALGQPLDSISVYRTSVG